MSLIGRIRAWWHKPTAQTGSFGPGSVTINSSTYLNDTQIAEILRRNNEELETRIITGLKNGRYGIKPSELR